MDSYIARISVTGAVIYSIFLQDIFLWNYVLNYETYNTIAPCNGLQGAVVQYDV